METLLSNSWFCFLFPPSDYRKKQNALRALQKKALDKNPDEFYFKMIHTQLRVRIHITIKQGYALALSNIFFCSALFSF